MSLAILRTYCLSQVFKHYRDVLLSYKKKEAASFICYETASKNLILNKQKY